MCGGGGGWGGGSGKEAAVDGCQRKSVPIEVHAFVKQRDWSVFTVLYLHLLCIFLYISEENRL